MLKFSGGSRNSLQSYIGRAGVGLWKVERGGLRTVCRFAMGKLKYKHNMLDANDYIKNKSDY